MSETRQTVVISLSFTIENSCDTSAEKLKDAVEDAVLDAQYEGNLAFDGSTPSCVDASVTGEYDAVGE